MTRWQTPSLEWRGRLGLKSGEKWTASISAASKDPTWRLCFQAECTAVTSRRLVDETGLLLPASRPTWWRPD